MVVVVGSSTGRIFSASFLSDDGNLAQQPRVRELNRPSAGLLGMATWLFRKASPVTADKRVAAVLAHPRFAADKYRDHLVRLGLIALFVLLCSGALVLAANVLSMWRVIPNEHELVWEDNQNELEKQVAAKLGKQPLNVTCLHAAIARYTACFLVRIVFRILIVLCCSSSLFVLVSALVEDGEEYLVFHRAPSVSQISVKMAHSVVQVAAYSWDDDSGSSVAAKPTLSHLLWLPLNSPQPLVHANERLRMRLCALEREQGLAVYVFGPSICAMIQGLVVRSNIASHHFV